MSGLEAWSFDVTTIEASYLDAVSLDAHYVLLSIAQLAFFSLPFGIAVAGSIRVGNLLGQGNARLSEVSARLTQLFGGTFMLCSGIVIVSARSVVGYLFSDDREVIALVAKIAPICALFQFFDGLQGTSSGILRGEGRQRDSAIINFASLWLVGVLSGYLFTFKLGLGVSGLWWGLTCGLFTAAVFNLILVSRTNWEEQVQKAKERLKLEAKQEETQVEEFVKEHPEIIVEEFNQPNNAHELQLIKEELAEEMEKEEERETERGLADVSITRPLVTPEVFVSSLVCPRLDLRVASPSDSDQLYDAISNSTADLLPWLPWVDKYDKSDALQFCIDAQAKFNQHYELHYVLFTRSSSELIGAIGVIHLNEPISTAEVRYWLKSTAVNHGYMQEALNKIVEHLFQHGFRTLVIQVDDTNARACQVAEKGGFTLHHTIMKADSISQQIIKASQTDISQHLIRIYQLTTRNP